MDNSNPMEMLSKMEEERKMQQAEMEIRYLGRKKQKEEYRESIENAAMKICGMIDAAPEAKRPEEIVALAAALSHAATAMHAVENYAESRPYFGVGLGYCGA